MSGGFQKDESAGTGRARPAFRPPAEREGLSLEQMNSALARLVGEGGDPYAESGERSPDEGAELDGRTVSPRSIFEALLFVGDASGAPLTLDRVAGLMRGVRPAEIEQLVRELNHDYEADGCPYRIEGQGAGYRMVLRDEYRPLREKLAGRSRLARLSAAAIEVLAIVAYNEPASAELVTRLRGGKAARTQLRPLVRRGLLRVERPADRPRTPVYRTTPRFLSLFGLASLDDLPRGPDVEPG